MPKFVSSSSGHVYAKDKLKEEEDEILAAIAKESETIGSQKPASINKKGTREKQKSSLELFKEELERLKLEREEQRNKIKNSLSQNPPQQAIPIPLKPDPRCPTTLTLQVNLNPKTKDASSNGSFDTGDPTTTNLYIGNLNPTVTENELCDIFGKFGPLASIKIMWPRTDEERARNRNSGFVAYMSRIDGERALKLLNGMDYKGYDMKLGWGKAVPLPKNPVFIPTELLKLLEPPPSSGMPFNAQLDSTDVERGYSVPTTYPQSVPPELESQIGNDDVVTTLDRTHKEFIEVFRRSRVRVCSPQDRDTLDRIHKTIEYVIREGPVFESIITAREAQNPDYRFLYDYDTPEHVYYRWKLYSILHGDDPHVWSTSEFRMYEDGPLWRPPPLNPFADGMPLELVEKLTGIDGQILKSDAPINHRKLAPTKGPLEVVKREPVNKGRLNPTDSKTLDYFLETIDPTKTKVGSAMLFCINHSDAAEEIITRVTGSICGSKVPFKRQIGLVFLISDILHNSHATVTNASYYREGLKHRLIDIFSGLRENLTSIEQSHQAERFKKKVLSVLGSWKYYQLYEDDFVLKLSKILYGQVKDQDRQTSKTLASLVDDSSLGETVTSNQSEDQLDGDPIDETLLTECLEAKGLSLRWYTTLELSDDERDDSDDLRSPSDDISETGQPDSEYSKRGSPENLPKERFKVSKWELITEEPENASVIVGKIAPTTLVGSHETPQKPEKSIPGTSLHPEKQ